ncbi:MAG: DUF6276 family protein [Halobacteriaceae archaeon]
MDCPNCGDEVIQFSIPSEVRPHLPDQRSGGAICTTCLRVIPIDDPPTTPPNPSTVSDAFPADSNAAKIIFCILALLDSPARYRSEIESLISLAERKGVDPLLILDRIARDESLEPWFDVASRTRTIDQLL